MSLFGIFPHNDTFDEVRELQITASPVDSQAATYTFLHNRQDYGIMRTEDALISAKIKIPTTADGAAPANDQVVVLCTAPPPLQLGWKSKEVYINNQLINPTSSKENELVWLNHLLTAVPSGYKDEEDITLMIHDTPGHFNSVVHVLDGTAGLVNAGARKRYVACSEDTELICLDHFDRFQTLIISL